MFIHKLLPATTALVGSLAIAVPVAGALGNPTAGTPAPSPQVCAQVASGGPMAVLGPYGVLGDYGPLGAHAGQPNPAAACGGTTSFALPGQTVGSFIATNLSVNGVSAPK